MNLSESVFEIAEKFMENPKFVSINYAKLYEVAEEMREAGKPKFPTAENNELIGCIHELVGNAINYCYWYGKHNIRPGNARASFMYECVQNAFFDYRFRVNFVECIYRLIEILAMKRFPLLEEREKHLKEIMLFGEDLAERIYDGKRDDYTPYLSALVAGFPGYGSDIFLKRASLYFLQLYRRFGWFEESLYNLHIPADYQVPRLMNYRGILEYNSELKYEIESERLIPKWSQKECEIRSATVLVAKTLVKELQWTVADVDGFFWLGSKQIQDPFPFHLTITTDY